MKTITSRSTKLSRSRLRVPFLMESISSSVNIPGDTNYCTTTFSGGSMSSISSEISTPSSMSVSYPISVRPGGDMSSLAIDSREPKRFEKGPSWLKVKKRSLEVRKSLKRVVNSLAVFGRELEIIEHDLAREICPCLDSISLSIMEFSRGVGQLFSCLRSTPMEKAIAAPFKLLHHFLSEVLGEPLLLLIRLVEFGFYIYEIETVMEEKMLPERYGALASSILEHLKMLCPGRVARQVYHVHVALLDMLFNGDAIDGLQERCHCRIAPLSRNNPRASRCPQRYRAFEVTFNPRSGDHIGLWHALERLAEYRIEMVRLAVSVVWSQSEMHSPLDEDSLVSTGQYMASVCEIEL